MPDLTARARSAVTLEEEALVIFEAVQHSGLPVEQRRELCRTVMMAGGKEVPRPALLGVVAALVPEDFGTEIRTYPQPPTGHRNTPIATVLSNNSNANPLRWDKAGFGDAASPALALLIAIREASHG